MSMAKVVGILSATCLVFVVGLIVLALIGLGDAPGQDSVAESEPSPSTQGGGNGQASPPANGGGQQGGAEATISAKDIKFNTNKLTVTAGQVTITFQNQESTVHNFAVFSKKGGDELGKTAIKGGPGTEKLSLNLKAGTYYFECEVHPDQMNGQLVAQ